MALSKEIKKILFDICVYLSVLVSIFILIIEEQYISLGFYGFVILSIIILKNSETKVQNNGF